ncbi:DUF4097 family beta strand repeat-containing protein [Niabella drilacis]|uniref:Adhesin domain-containing protein n=1 Tax=Niabella drilacis (strain DSM 25811 / CCM 8410 / CCUG 62505 / LMG 26954 / E90) TaxID=1285928 RepID=A0A1G6XKH0_NIADE|nr:hypothetical protein [Niabella drilacis]SDD78640.1 hypothetical protein SAMN04487894_113108 [Niabella drilacis]
MKKIVVTIILSVALVSLAGAQERQFKLSKKTGTLKVNIPGVTIEGYDGNEVIFSAPELKREAKDERAEGLKLVTGSGLTDNTGLNLSVRENGGTIDVDYVGKMDRERIAIKVPNTMSVKVATTGVMNGNRPVDIKDFKGELEISTMYNAISLQNITGPVNAKTIYGELSAKFVSTVKGPVSLVSVYKFVDVSIPSGLKANVNISSQNGNIYAADGLDIKREQPKEKKSNDGEDLTGLTEWSRSSDIKGTLNGGGVDLILKTNYGKIYLRKN